MNHIKLFENFDMSTEALESMTPVTADKLGSKEYWSQYDVIDGATSEYWNEDPGYQALSGNLKAPLDGIHFLNSEEFDSEEIMDRLQKSSPSASIDSNQEYISSWDYYPEHGAAIAYGNGGAPDYIFFTQMS